MSLTFSPDSHIDTDTDTQTDARTDTGITGFDRDTRIVPHRAGTYRADLLATWLSATGVHGGYQVAMAVRAAQAHSPGRHLRTLSTSFLRPGQPGEVIFTVDEVRRGRSLSTLLVEQHQDGRLLNTTRLTLTTELDGARWHAPVETSLPSFDRCVPLVGPPGVLHFDHATAVLDPANMPFADGPLAKVGGYMRPLEPRPIDAPWLAMALDWFPPSPFGRGNPPVGAVSIDYTIHLHRTLDTLADDEWLAGEFAADVSSGGLALEKGRLLGPDGALVAESFHTRWTA